jgi:hypothetical protein
MAALAPAVAPMPVNLTALVKEPVFDNLDHLGQLADQASLLQSQHVNFGQAEAVRVLVNVTSALNFKS